MKAGLLSRRPRLWPSQSRRSPRAHSASTAGVGLGGAPASFNLAQAARPTSRPSAQTAIARTRAEGLSSFSSAIAASAGSPLLPAAIRTLRMKRAKPMRLTGAARKQRPKGGIVKAKQIGDFRRDEVRRAPAAWLRGRNCREFVPRAGGEAIVAAIDAVADGGAEFARDMALVLDRQIGDAAARIEHVGMRKRIGRAGVETGAALAAMIRLGFVRRRSRFVKIAPRKSQEPNSRETRLRMLALPAEPSRLRHRLFHHRRRIDEDLELRCPRLARRATSRAASAGL